MVHVHLSVFFHTAALILLGNGSLFNSLISQVSAQQQQEELTSSFCSRKLSDPVILDTDGLVSLQQVKNTDTGTFTMKITYTGGQSWIGIGINLDGRVKMTPTVAVIGRVENEMETSVLKYRLASDDEDASGVLQLSDELQQTGLYNASFRQNFDTDETILEFTADLEGDLVVSDDSFWVYGVGLPDNAWIGKHRIHGGFQLPLTDNCISQQPGSSPTDLTIDDENNLGSSDENPFGATGVVLYGTKSTGETLYLVHGICMALAWGLIAPLAIGASFVRQLSCLQRNATWLKLHLYLNLSVVLLTTIGFALAVVAANENEEDHFNENVHTKAGLAIFLLVFVQAFFGYIRPAAKKVKSSIGDNSSDELPSKKAMDGSGEKSAETMPADNTLHATSAENDGSNDDDDDNTCLEEERLQQSSSKTKLRVVWEIGHRLLAFTLLGLAWYNCTTGIALHIEEFDDETTTRDENEAAKPWIALFWGVSGGISLVILVGGSYLRCQQASK